jgi:uncharacterized integral membrane protein
MNQPTTHGDGGRGKFVRRALGAKDGSGIDKHRIAVIVLAVAVFLLIVQNSERTRLKWLFFEFTAPVWVMGVATLVAGALGWELLKRGRHRRKVKARATATLPPPTS